MKILIVKTSSMGDVIHTLPAVTDVVRTIPDAMIDWVVEEGFAEIPTWHPAIRRVIPVAIRRWRKEIFPPWKMRGHSMQWRNFKQALQQENYDVVIDAQGLLKSAILAKLAHGPVTGFDKHSAREPLASFFYTKRLAVAKEQHAVGRTRQLFAQALGYSMPSTPGMSGLHAQAFGNPDPRHLSVMFLHGTTRGDKHWPDEYWVKLCRLITDAGVSVTLPWYNDIEKVRAEKIAAVSSHARLLPKSDLKELAKALAESTAFVAVDTGLGHLGAALNTRGVSLYGATSPARVGAYGAGQIHLQKSSMKEITVDEVWQTLKTQFPKHC